MINCVLQNENESEMIETAIYWEKRAKLMFALCGSK